MQLFYFYLQFTIYYLVFTIYNILFINIYYFNILFANIARLEALKNCFLVLLVEFYGYGC